MFRRRFLSSSLAPHSLLAAVFAIFPAILFPVPLQFLVLFVRPFISHFFSHDLLRSFAILFETLHFAKKNV